MSVSSIDSHHALALGGIRPLKAGSTGLLISRGDMCHPNRVTDFFDLIFVRQGKLSICENGRFFQVHAGETLLLWPWRRHWGTATYPQDLEFFWLHFTLFMGEEPSFSDAPLDIRQHMTVQRPNVLAEMFRRYMNETETGELTPLQRDLTVWMILAEAVRDRVPEEITRADMLAGQAYRHIRSHFHLPLTASTVAAAVECNPQHLSRVFRKVYQQTLTQCIFQTRVERARILLIHSSLNVGEIARACGFDDVGYFYRMFRRHEGITALTYRRRHALTPVVLD